MKLGNDWSIPYSVRLKNERPVSRLNRGAGREWILYHRVAVLRCCNLVAICGGTRPVGGEPSEEQRRAVETAVRADAAVLVRRGCHPM